MTATLTSDNLDNDRCPKCGLRINDTTLVAIPRAQHEALMAAKDMLVDLHRLTGYVMERLRAAGIQMEE